MVPRVFNSLVHQSPAFWPKLGRRIVRMWLVATGGCPRFCSAAGPSPMAVACLTEVEGPFRKSDSGSELSDLLPLNLTGAPPPNRPRSKSPAPYFSSTTFWIETAHGCCRFLCHWNLPGDPFFFFSVRSPWLALCHERPRFQSFSSASCASPSSPWVTLHETRGPGDLFLRDSSPAGASSSSCP